MSAHIQDELDESDFPERLRLRAPRGLPSAIKLAARRRHTSASEWMRQVLIRGLDLDGVMLAPNGEVRDASVGLSAWGSTRYQNQSRGGDGGK